MVLLAFDFVACLFQAFLICVYAHQCFTPKEKNHPRLFTLYLSVAVFLILPLFIPSLAQYELLLFVLPLLYAYLFAKDNFPVIVFWCVLLALIFNLVTGTVGKLFHVVTRFVFPLSPTANTLTYIGLVNLLLSVYLFFIVQFKHAIPSPNPHTHIPFLAMLSALLLVEEALYRSVPSSSINNPVLYCLIYLGLLLATFLSIYLFQAVSKSAYQASKLQAEVLLLNKSVQHQHELSQIYSKLAVQQHDLKHHIEILEKMAEEHLRTPSADYISALKQSIKAPTLYITGCAAMDALLVAKSLTMAANHIDFIYIPYPLHDLPVSSMELCTITANLLDNAIEGVARIPDTDVRSTVRLRFSRSWNMFHIACENPCNPETIVHRGNTYLSSKQSGTLHDIHGLGIYSIQKIVDQHEGFTQFICESNVFYANVTLPYLSTIKGAEKQ